MSRVSSKEPTRKAVAACGPKAALQAPDATGCNATTQAQRLQSERSSQTQPLPKSPPPGFCSHAEITRAKVGVCVPGPRGRFDLDRARRGRVPGDALDGHV